MASLKKRICDENDLVLQVKLGNDAAFRELFFKYYHKIFYFAQGFLKVKEDAEEVVHDVFIQVWDNRKKLDPSKSFEGYVRTVTRNLVYNLLKKKSYHQLYLDYKKTQKVDLRSQIEEQIYFEELEKLSREAYDNLPSRRKEIFRLSREEGLTHKEIAEKLGISINTVKDQMTKALIDIRNYISKCSHVPHSLVFLIILKFFQNF